MESSKWKEAMDKEESITLNQKKFDQLMKTRKAQIEKFNSLDKFRNGLSFSIFPEEIEREKKDEAFKKKTENWIKNLQKDLFVEEAIHIITDMQKAK